MNKEDLLRVYLLYKFNRENPSSNTIAAVALSEDEARKWLEDTECDSFGKFFTSIPVYKKY